MHGVVNVIDHGPGRDVIWTPDMRQLGRRYSPDPNDLAWAVTEPLMRAVAVVTKPRKLPWKLGPLLDQGSSSECTIFTGVQLIQSAPWVHLLNWARSQFTDAYRGAQRKDEWPGEEPTYYGTSFRAALKELQECGLVTSYHLVRTEDQAKEWLARDGMLGFGSDWLSGLDRPDRHGYVEPTGSVRGGHEYVKRWYYGPRHYKYPDTYEFVNSWGRWGWNGRGIFRMKADAVRYLWHDLNGDLYAMVENFRRSGRRLLARENIKELVS
jgi:hypothetical protein